MGGGVEPAVREHLGTKVIEGARSGCGLAVNVDHLVNQCSDATGRPLVAALFRDIIRSSCANHPLDHTFILR